jgi:hypothetical protein
MKKEVKSKALFAKKPKNKYTFLVPIPPCSVLSVRRVALGHVKWEGDSGLDEKEE